MTTDYRKRSAFDIQIATDEESLLEAFTYLEDNVFEVDLGSENMLLKNDQMIHNTNIFTLKIRDDRVSNLMKSVRAIKLNGKEFDLSVNMLKREDSDIGFVMTECVESYLFTRCKILQVDHGVLSKNPSKDNNFAFKTLRISFVRVDNIFHDGEKV